MSTRQPGLRGRSVSVILFAAVWGAWLAAGPAVADSSRGVLVDFSATWCGPCQQVAPVVQKLEREGLPVRTVDVDDRPDLTRKYGIQTIPTFLLIVDGKEVFRKQGVMAERELRGLLDRIPSAPRTRGRDDARPPRDGRQRGSRPQDGRQLDGTRTVIAAAETPLPRGLRGGLGLFPKLRTKPPTETAAVVRGNNESGGVATRAGGPMGASVLVKVSLEGRQNFGSGTVVASRPGRAIIVSCAHVVRGVDEDSRIEVDTFFEGRPRTYVGRLVGVDAEADVSVLEVPTADAWPAVRVASAGHAPRESDAVLSIGCGGGKPPTKQSLRITAINRWNGPANIECTGLPIVGRSGGGLFDARGELVGVCINADDQPGEADDRGIYAGLAAVHDLLDKVQMSGLYREDSLLASAGDAAADRSEPPQTAMLDTSAAGADAVASNAPVTDADRPAAGGPSDLEFVVIVRCKSRPDLPSKVVIADDANPELLKLLRQHMRQD